MRLKDIFKSLRGKNTMPSDPESTNAAAKPAAAEKPAQEQPTSVNEWKGKVDPNIGGWQGH